MSGFLMALHGPLHLTAKCQTITSQLSTKQKFTQQVNALNSYSFSATYLNISNQQMIFLLHLKRYKTTTYLLFNGSTKNSKKYLLHSEKENAVLGLVANHFVQFKHVNDKMNLVDIFTKEDKDIAHFFFHSRKNLIPSFSTPFQYVSLNLIWLF